MGKWMKWRAGFSGFMAVAVLAGSFSASAAVQERIAVYEGVLICGQEGHTHNRSCYDLASPSNEKEADSGLVCGLEEHVHDDDCYERGERVTGTQTPEPEGTEAEESGTGDTVSEESAQENGKIEGSGMEETDSEDTDLEDVDLEDTDLEDVDSEDTDLEDVDSEDMDSEDVDLEDTDLEDADSEDTDSEGVDSEDTDSEGVDSEDTDLKEKGSEDMDSEDTDSEETDQEEEAALMSAAPKRSGDTFEVSSFGGLQAAVLEANKAYGGDEGDYQIVLQDDIEWDDKISVRAPLLLDMNGHSIRISKAEALYVTERFMIQGNGKENITIASSVEGEDYIIRASGLKSELVLDNVRIIAEDSQKALPPLIRTDWICTLNDVTVEDYLVHGSLIKVEPCGGVFGKPYSGLTIQDSMFSGIHSDGRGAVVSGDIERTDGVPQYIHPGKVTIDNTVFKENVSERGGAIYLWSKNGLEIKGSIFEGNQAANGDGGAVYFSGQLGDNVNADIDGCVFTDNKAAEKGGAIYCEYSDLSITNGTFEGNKAFDGGAVAASNVDIRKTEFTDNRAETNGGAIYTDSTVSMEEVALVANKAGFRGGAVYMEKGGTGQSELILYDAVITGNYASENGHAVECTDGLQMEGGRCPAIFENHPLDGNGIYLHSSAGAAVVYGTMLGEGDANLEILYESGADKQTLHKGETAAVDPTGNGAAFLAFHPAEKEGILDLSPVVLMDGNAGGVAGSAVYGTSITFITSEKKVPEKPEPEEPEKPEPEKPEEPEPEKPETEEPEKPEQGKPGGGASSSWGSGSSSSGESGSVSRAGGSSVSSGMSITKPYYVHSTAGGREMSETRSGWRLRKPDGSYAASEWVMEADGSWYLYGEDGYTCSGWQRVNGEWYFFDEAAQSMKTGWLIREGKWYYLDAAGGSMKTGWVLLEGKWYFLSPDGMLVTNGYTPDGYYVDDNGEWKRRVLAVKSR